MGEPLRRRPAGNEVSEDSASYALRVLRERGLVRRRPAGRVAFYSLGDADVREALVGALRRLNGLR